MLFKHGFMHNLHTTYKPTSQLKKQHIWKLQDPSSWQNVWGFSTGFKVGVDSWKTERPHNSAHYVWTSSNIHLRFKTKHSFNRFNKHDLEYELDLFQTFPSVIWTVDFISETKDGVWHLKSTLITQTSCAAQNQMMSQQNRDHLLWRSFDCRNSHVLHVTLPSAHFRQRPNDRKLVIEKIKTTSGEAAMGRFAPRADHINGVKLKVW